MQARQAFAQENCAEKDVDEWRHEITEARLENAVNEHREDEEEPVRRDGEAGGQTEKRGASGADDRFHFGPASLP